MKHLLLAATAGLILFTSCQGEMEKPLAVPHVTAALPSSNLYETTSSKDDCVLPKSNCAREVSAPDVDLLRMYAAVADGPDSIQSFFLKQANVAAILPQLLEPGNAGMLSYLQGTGVYGYTYYRSGKKTTTLFSHHPAALPENPDFALRFDGQ